MKYVELVIMVATLFLCGVTVGILYFTFIEGSKRDQGSSIPVSDGQPLLHSVQPESFQSKEIQRLLIALDDVNLSLPKDAMSDLLDRVNYNLPGLCVSYREEEGYYLKPMSISQKPLRRKTDDLSKDFDPDTR